jgi:hypothetical protein
MSNQFSDWFNASQPASTITAPAVKVPWGVNNRHYKRASAILDLSPQFGVGENCRMITVKSTDRISAVFISATSASTVTAVDVGLYLAGAAHDGAVADADLFASAVDLGTAAVNRSEVFAESGVNAVSDRGQMVWELLGLSADNGLEYDVCLTATGAVTTADEPVVLEIYGSFS